MTHVYTSIEKNEKALSEHEFSPFCKRIGSVQILLHHNRLAYIQIQLPDTLVLFNMKMFLNLVGVMSEPQKTCLQNISLHVTRWREDFVRMRGIELGTGGQSISRYYKHSELRCGLTA